MPVPPHEFRETLGRFASGVTIVTAAHDGERRGMTASAFVSVSLTPPLILVSVGQTASMHARLMDVDRFGVNVLSVQQKALSAHFAGRPDEGLSVPWMDHEGLPLIGGAVAAARVPQGGGARGGRPHAVHRRGGVQPLHITDCP